jgi:hypothetical protein
MVRNAKPKYDANGNFIINKGSASGRIDALPAMANAVALYINAEALGIAGNINTQESVYNKRGLIFV